MCQLAIKQHTAIVVSDRSTDLAKYTSWVGKRVAVVSGCYTGRFATVLRLCKQKITVRVEGQKIGSADQIDYNLEVYPNSLEAPRAENQRTTPASAPLDASPTRGCTLHTLQSSTLQQTQRQVATHCSSDLAVAHAPLAALAPAAICRGLKRRLSDTAIDGRERVLQKVEKVIEGTVGKLNPGTANGLSLCRQLSDEFTVILDSVIDRQLEGSVRDVESFQQSLGDETLGAIQTTNVSANPEMEALLYDETFSEVLHNFLMSEEVFIDLQEVLQIEETALTSVAGNEEAVRAMMAAKEEAAAPDTLADEFGDMEFDDIWSTQEWLAADTFTCSPIHTPISCL